MAHYLVQVAYTPEAWANLVANPHNRLEALKPVLKKLGAKFEAGWFAFGEYDVVAILNAPDNISAGAFAVAAAAGGAVKALKTTPLMSMEDGMEVLKKAAACGYKPPQ